MSFYTIIIQLRILFEYLLWSSLSYKYNFSINITLIEGENFMYEKKPNNYTSPDLTKMQAVVIDIKTIIYIALDADPKLARSSYLSRIGLKKL